MDKLIVTIMTIDTLERAKNSIEKKAIKLAAELQAKPSKKGEAKLATILEQHARIDEQLKRIYSMQTEIRNALSDENDLQVAELEITANTIAA